MEKISLAAPGKQREAFATQLFCLWHHHIVCSICYYYLSRYTHGSVCCHYLPGSLHFRQHKMMALSACYIVAHCFAHLNLLQCRSLYDCRHADSVASQKVLPLVCLSFFKFFRVQTFPSSPHSMRIDDVSSFIIFKTWWSGNLPIRLFAWPPFPQTPTFLAVHETLAAPLRAVEDTRTLQPSFFSISSPPPHSL